MRIVWLAFSLFAMQAEAATIYLPRRVTIYAQNYSLAEKNLAALSDLKAKGIKFKLGTFTPAEGDKGSLMCRSWFPVNAPSGISFSEFLNAALVSELSEVGVYSESEGIELSLKVESIDFESFGSGKWIFRASITTAKKEPLVITYEHPFEIAFAAPAACRAVGSAFMPGTQAFLNAIYSDPKFLVLFEP